MNLDAAGRLVPDPDDGRTQHYGVFYGVQPLPQGPDPLVVVMGNCQAESLRLLLDAAGSVRAVRVPPVFELEGPELHLLDRLLSHVDVLVAQPIRAGYRGLALGTDELAARLRPGSRVLRVPAIRYAGLHPYQVVLRVPGLGDPPGVPYSDLRTVVEAATGRRPTRWRPAGIRAVAAASVAELRRREQAAGTVPVSDLLAPAGVDAAHVVNHPGNPVLLGLAARVRTALGLPGEAPDPGLVLLDEVHAPLYAEVLDALGLDAAPREYWRYRGADVDDEQIRAVQLAWLAQHPQAVDLALARHRPTLEELGWL